MTDFKFYQGKRVFVTGHTGFKGSWMSRLLLELGAEVIGYALEPPTDPSMYRLCRLDKEITTFTGDIRDLESLANAVRETRPELLIHMAAQPLVGESYQNPVDTFDVNVMGTVHVLECIRTNESIRSFVNVTTDKVYENREWEWGYRENERLGGYDPYSSSKACSELVTASYRSSFFGRAGERSVPITTVRAGNVIGGGDFAADRIVPDCVRAASAGQKIAVRNPNSVRPYQHVLEPLAVYLMILQKQYENPELAGSYNAGPEEKDCWNTGRLAEAFCRHYKQYTGKDAQWESVQKDGPHEANYLKLDCARLKQTFGWKPCWDVEAALKKTVEWYACHQSGGDVTACTDRQIQEFLEDWKQQETKS